MTLQDNFCCVEKSGAGLSASIVEITKCLKPKLFSLCLHLQLRGIGLDWLCFTIVSVVAPSGAI